MSHSLFITIVMGELSQGLPVGPRLDQPVDHEQLSRTNLHFLSISRLIQP